jgi:arylsulfatase A-like enzyme
MLEAQYAHAQAQIRECGFDYVERINIGNTEEIHPKAIRFQNMEWHTEGALEFLDKFGKQPFFLYFPTPVPHGNYAPKVFQTRDPLATTAGMLDKAPTPQPSREDVLARLRAAAIDERHAMGTWQDDSVGAILRKLEELGVADNTMVIHISDHQSRGKYTCYEGARVPAAIRWPGKIRAGTRIDALCANIDIHATLIEAAGGAVPGDLGDGRSLLPLLLGSGQPPADWRDSLFLEISNIRAVVTKDWKFIANRTTGKIRDAIEADVRAAAAENRPRRVGWEGSPDPKGKGVRYASDRAFPAYFDPDQLYDLRSDWLEQRNLASDPAHAGQLAKMKDLLRTYLARLPHSFGEFTSP